ncbi:uncharacterized protein LOC128958589 [Oppia nitens]|uniref:uncharacterized protein LOC128958589 n=1 Tax=Oppia nitens TaxID=1686743 RepID=UPI0023DB8929|nr:uncharacterized protein LOC128958589 [Oppia nitens]
MANEFNKFNINTTDEDIINDELIDKLFPKCRPKNKTTNEFNDINKNYSLRDKHILIDLDVINDNTMNDNKDKARDRDCVQQTDNYIKSNLTNIGFKLDQLLLSPEEEYKPMNYNFCSKPSIGSNEDIDSDRQSNNGNDVTLRESRIEIAGGREIFSASKNKFSKRKHLSHHNIHNEDKAVSNATKSKRNNTTQTVVNNDISVESNSTINSMTTNSSINQLLQSPISDLLTDLSKGIEHKHTLTSGIVVYEDVISNTESEIIYDDIEDLDKKDIHLSVKPIETNSKNSDNSVKEIDVNCDPIVKCNELEIEEEVVENNCNESDCSKDSISFGDRISIDDENKEIARVIGNVPIAQYEGSPRRYGPKPPGYPQRVINNDELSVGLANSSNESNKGLVDISCDELVKSILSIPTQYEDSPTNSCTNASNGSKSQSSGIQSAAVSESDRNEVLVESSDTKMYPFSDLDYKLYRMDNKVDKVGNLYVGKRLATQSSADSEDDTSVAVSPSKSLNNDSNQLIAHENELILLHERVRQHILNEMVSSDRISVGTGVDTEPEVEHKSKEMNRNFTLSPDITDCDSNEIESELSLEGSLLSNKLVMPVLEDGLSSGVPSSDNELDDDNESPTHISNSKKQMCERLERELVAKLNAKLKRNDGIQEHQIAYNSHHSHNKSVTTHNHYDNYRNDTNDTQNYCHENKSNIDEVRDKQISSDHNKDCNNINDGNGCQQNESYDSIWVPRTNETNVNKSVNANTDDSTNCEQQNVSRHHHHDEDCDTDQETDRLLGAQRCDDRGFFDHKERLNFRFTSMSSLFKLNPRNNDYIRIENCCDEQSNPNKRSNATREAFNYDPTVLIEGVLFRARYLGSTQLVCEGQPTKATRMMQAEEAVSRIKAPDGETQPSTDVDLFISTEKIMVLNTDLKEIMMDHSLRTISYIADIGDLLVLMARRRILNPMDESNESGIKRIPKMICHIFESEEAQFIAQSIGQAFQVAYMEFLKANGIEDSSFVKEMDYQEVLNSQQIFGNELEMFAKKEKQKEVIVPKQKGEILGMVIVESGWGSMLPTVVIANMAQHGPSARCGQLNIGDQIIAINGVSLVGLPLSTCQNYIKNTKNQTVVKFTVVPCPPVVEVKIKRPDTKYQLGFSVQNGVICSLLRGGIAERGGVRVGHRIIEINGQSVVAVPHDRIVNLLATSVGEILMKTMPTSMFRLLTGQEMPTYM